MMTLDEVREKCNKPLDYFECEEIRIAFKISRPNFSKLLGYKSKSSYKFFQEQPSKKLPMNRTIELPSRIKEFIPKQIESILIKYINGIEIRHSYTINHVWPGEEKPLGKRGFWGKDKEGIIYYIGKSLKNTKRSY